MADEKRAQPDDAIRLAVVMGDDRTTDHAIRLVVSGKKKPKGCDDLSITCAPTLVSCEPVAQCANYDIPAPGCSPLECDPVKTQPSR